MRFSLSNLYYGFSNMMAEQGSDSPSASKYINSFIFYSTDNAGLSTDVHGTITDNKIRIDVPIGTNASSLAARFTTTGILVTAHDIPQESGITTNNFLSPQT